MLLKFESVGKWFCREFIAAWPVLIFLLVGFLLLLSIIKLALATFSIEVTAFSKAVVGGCLLPRRYSYSTRRRSRATCSSSAES